MDRFAVIEGRTRCLHGLLVSSVAAVASFCLAAWLCACSGRTQPGPKKSFDELFEKVEEFSLVTDEAHPMSDFIFLYVSPRADIVIYDYSAGRLVYLFDAKGRFVRVVGRQGKGPGEYLYPMYINFDRSGNIYVYDGNLMRVTKYDRQGDYVSSFLLASNGDSFQVNSLGEVFVYSAHPYGSDSTICCYDTVGCFVGRFAIVPKNFSRDIRIGGGNIVIDGADNIYEITPQEYLISKFNRKGNLVQTFGVRSSMFRPMQKPTQPLRPGPQGIGKWLQSVTHIQNLHLIKKQYLIVEMVNVEASAAGSIHFFDLYNLEGVSVASEVEFPKDLGMIRTSGDYLCGIKQARQDTAVAMQNPVVVKYRMR